MSMSGKNGSHRFEDLWQGIYPGLEPPPSACGNFARPNEECGAEPSVPHTLHSAPLAADDEINCLANPYGESETVFIKSRRQQEGDILRFYQTLIKKCPRRISHELAPLEQTQQMVLRRLITVYFLRTGEPGEPCSSCPYICSVPHAIRNLCNEEAACIDEYMLAASEYRRIRRMCEEIAQIKAFSSHELEMLLGRIMHK